MSILRFRVVLISLMGVVVAAAAGDVFDRRVLILLAVPASVGTVALVTTNRRWPLRLGGAIVSILVAVAIVVFGSRGDLADFITAFTGGPQRLLSTDWPSPNQSDLLGTIAAAIATLIALAAELSRRVRLHLTPLVPIVVAHLLVIALSSPLGARLGWLVPLGLLAVLFATMRPVLALPERWKLLAGERRLLPVVAIALGLAVALAVPLSLVGRSDPRRNDPPNRSESLLDPIEATLALQEIDPPIDLHTLDLDDPSNLAPTRFRTAALVAYDGRRWAPALTLRPIGRRLATSSDDDLADDRTVQGTISFLDDDLQLVPLPGSPVIVDARIETDADRTLVRLADRPEVGEVVEVVSHVSPTTTAVAPGSIGNREIDESVSGLSELAESIVADSVVGGDPTSVDILGQLQILEEAMRTDFVLDSNASGGGLQRALILRFLRDTRRGNAEQFATAFVLLARSLGVDARVATGFVIDAGRVQRTGDRITATLTSADAAIWPEVRAGDDWLAFDPVPVTEISDAVPEPPETQIQTPAAPQPPIAPPPEANNDPVVTEDNDEADSATTLPTVVVFGLRVLAVIGLLVLPLLAIVLLILGLKWRRRRRTIAGPPDHRIRGAWSVATNRLVDAGMTITSAETNDEIANDGISYAASAQRELRRLATLASAATFGSPARPDLLADDARACLGQVETCMAESRTRWQRLRWRLSLRSLRRKTSSPV